MVSCSTTWSISLSLFLSLTFSVAISIIRMHILHAHTHTHTENLSAIQHCILPSATFGGCKCNIHFEAETSSGQFYRTSLYAMHVYFILYITISILLATCNMLVGEHNCELGMHSALGIRSVWLSTLSTWRSNYRFEFKWCRSFDFISDAF